MLAAGSPPGGRHNDRTSLAMNATADAQRGKAFNYSFFATARQIQAWTRREPVARLRPERVCRL
jgi:hypothetical protein